MMVGWVTVNKSSKNNPSIKEEDNLYGEAWVEDEKQLENIVNMI